MPDLVDEGTHEIDVMGGHDQAKDQLYLTELQATSDDDLIKNLAKNDKKKAAVLRELLGPPDTFDVPEVRH